MGDQQAPGAGAAEPTAAGTERPLQPAAGTAPEPYRHTGEQELCCMFVFLFY